MPDESGIGQLPITQKGETAPEARGAANRAKMSPSEQEFWSKETPPKEIYPTGAEKGGFQGRIVTRGGDSDYGAVRTARKSME